MIPIGLHPLPAGIGIFTIMLAAFAVDALLGDPPRVYRRIPHPVVLIGRAIAACEARWNLPEHTDRARYWRGALVVLLIVSTTVAIAWVLSGVARQFAYGWCAEALAASTLIAYGSLRKHVRDVAAGLAQNIDAGRAAVGKIVGRAPENLDEPGVARAAIESAAENFSDGVIAPLFWLALFGLPGIAAYKAINTLDSMIGYRNERYLRFGAVAARLDDAANWIPARITGGLICLAAVLTRGADPQRAAAVMVRDARKHASPNAGWPEAAMAGALGVALGGPRIYGRTLMDAPRLGEDYAEPANEADIRQTLTILRRAAGILGVLILLAALVGAG